MFIHVEKLEHVITCRPMLESVGYLSYFYSKYDFVNVENFTIFLNIYKNALEIHGLNNMEFESPCKNLFTQPVYIYVCSMYNGLILIKIIYKNKPIIKCNSILLNRIQYIFYYVFNHQFFILQICITFF